MSFAMRLRSFGRMRSIQAYISKKNFHVYLDLVDVMHFLDVGRSFFEGAILRLDQVAKFIGVGMPYFEVVDYFVLTKLLRKSLLRRSFGLDLYLFMMRGRVKQVQKHVIEQYDEGERIKDWLMRELQMVKQRKPMGLRI